VDAAVDAAKKFKFKPFIRNGKPVKVTTKLPFDFHFFDKVVSDGLPYENGKGGSGNSTPDANPVKRIKVSSGVAQAMIIRKVAPAYPPDARGNGIQGTVVLHAIIGKDGHILSLTPISGTQELIRASIGAVQQWVYRPYLLMGEPVEVDTQVTVNFSLNRF
jgi:protein TonB